MLKFALDNDIIDISYMQEQINMKKREEILKKHPYKIWKGKDNKWYTYIPNGENRILKKRNSLKDIEDIIIKYNNDTQIIFISDIFNEWLEWKIQYGDIKKQTYDRYKTDFIRFFSKSDIVKKDIRCIEENDIEDFIRECICKQNLTQKSYSGLRLLITGIFKYAKKK